MRYVERKRIPEIKREILESKKSMDAFFLEKYPIIDNIIQVVCDYFVITREEMFSDTRKRKIVIPKFISYYFIRQKVEKYLSDQNIADYLNIKREAYYYGRNTIEDQLPFNGELREIIRVIGNRLNTGDKI